ncbi:hypothetical protein KBC03_05470 [Patescibacteria group bacterium]|nr:hypothetical protein [Patescibacteria group bacterium]
MSSSAYALIPGPTYNYLNGYVSSTNMLFFDQETATSALTPGSCAQANVYKDYYLAMDQNNDGIKDLGINYYGRDNFVMNGGTIPAYLIGGRQAGYAGTKVRYYLPAGGQNILTKLVGSVGTPIHSQNVFYAQSKIAPKDVWVRAIESAAFLLSAPENNSTASRTFQLAYEIAYRPFSARAAGTKTNNYWLYPVSAGDGGPVSTKWYIKSSWSSAKPVWSSDYAISSAPVSAAQIDRGTERRVAYECLNGTVHWCGDGIVDNGSFNIGIASEQCDLGSANGTPGSACTAACKLPLAPLKPDLAIVKSVT